MVMIETKVYLKMEEKLFEYRKKYIKSEKCLVVIIENYFSFRKSGLLSINIFKRV